MNESILLIMFRLTDEKITAGMIVNEENWFHTRLGKKFWEGIIKVLTHPYKWEFSLGTRVLPAILKKNKGSSLSSSLDFALGSLNCCYKMMSP